LNGSHEIYFQIADRPRRVKQISGRKEGWTASAATEILLCVQWDSCYILQIMKLSSQAFDEAVQRAIRGIPAEIRRHLDNVLITVRRRPTAEMRKQLDIPMGEEPLGFYWGSSLAERSFFSPLDYPDTIFIFQDSLEEMCDTRKELEEQIRITVIHEIAHFLGIDEERLDELGYG